MPFIFDKSGEKVKVDCDMDTFAKKCILYHDEAILRDVYILNLYHGKSGSGFSSENPPTLVKQIEFWGDPPTQERIMFEMWESGLSRYDIATVEKGQMLDWSNYPR